LALFVPLPENVRLPPEPITKAAVLVPLDTPLNVIAVAFINPEPVAVRLAPEPTTIAAEVLTPLPMAPNVVDIPTGRGNGIHSDFCPVYETLTVPEILNLMNAWYPVPPPIAPVEVPQVDSVEALETVAELSEKFVHGPVDEVSEY